MGATVDIQRQQRMELLDRQLTLAQFAHSRRQRQQQGGMINWNRLFLLYDSDGTSTIRMVGGLNHKRPLL